MTAPGLALVADVVAASPDALWAWPWARVTAVAVAMAESGGNPDAVNVVHKPGWVSDLSLDLGLWQVNTYWHPEVGIAASLDPERAVLAASAISDRGRTWRPWNAYLAGKHVQFVPAALLALRERGVKV